MKFNYFPDTDTLYIDLADRPGIDSDEVSPRVVSADELGVERER